MGDAFMTSFESVTKAVECAIAIHRAFHQREGEQLASESDETGERPRFPYPALYSDGLIVNSRTYRFTPFTGLCS
jgi:hypothetical protein